MVFAVSGAGALGLLWLVALVFGIWCLVDMARRPSWQWEQARSNKVLWIVLEAITLIGLLAIVVGVLYLIVVRPRLVAAEQQGQSATWPAFGAPPSGQWMPPASAPPTAASPPPYPGAPGQAPYPAAPPAPYPAAPVPAPPFGWYPDPSARHELRYWDGRTWTEHVSDGGQQSIDPLPS
ncbi:MAG: DUF2510 domain-containing protein [Acidimicrobiales bacterium]